MHTPRPKKGKHTYDDEQGIPARESRRVSCHGNDCLVAKIPNRPKRYLYLPSRRLLCLSPCVFASHMYVHPIYSSPPVSPPHRALCIAPQSIPWRRTPTPLPPPPTHFWSSGGVRHWHPWAKTSALPPPQILTFSLQPNFSPHDNKISLLFPTGPPAEDTHTITAAAHQTWKHAHDHSKRGFPNTIRLNPLVGQTNWPIPTQSQNRGK